MHPYFADLDEELLPAVGEEFVGLPIDRIPPAFAEVFKAVVAIADSDLDIEELGEGSKEEGLTADKRVVLVLCFFHCKIYWFKRIVLFIY